jgi:hypothetical protein
MADLTASSARTAIDVAEASEIARMARTGDPNVLSTDALQRLLGNSALVLDGLRRRPRYFDGKFLTGADLTRDQDYIRQRQADLARATGTGVITGLQVSVEGSAGGEQVVIRPGHGVTPSGDLVMVTTRRRVPLLDLPTTERLDSTLGLRAIPRSPLGRRTGLFLLALRPVEFSANPIAAYPTSIAGPRQIEDSEIIEATAITMIPYPDTGGAATLAEARRHVARKIFLGEAVGLPQDALPLAMVAMERGTVRWVDVAMVRRETGADTPLAVSIGARPRPLAEAFVTQYRTHLMDVLIERRRGGLSDAFAAMQYFAALPSAGPMPAAAILPDAFGFRQLWFPPALDVTVSFVPADEIAVIVEESLAMPPIDFSADPAELDATGVVVLAPVSRQRLQKFLTALEKPTIAVRPDPSQGLRQTPLATLQALSVRRSRFAETARRDAAAEAQAAAAEATIRAWQAAWAEAVAAIQPTAGLTPLVWYIRRRAVPSEAKVTGIAVPIGTDDAALTRAVAARLADLNLTPRVTAINARATPFAVARINAFLGAPRISASDILVASAVRDLEVALPPAPTAPPPVTPAPTDPRPTTPIPGPIVTRPGVAPGRGAIGTEVLRARVPGGTTRLADARLVTNLAIRARVPAGQPELLTEADVVDVASDYGDARLGDGLDRLAATMAKEPLARDGLLWLGDSGQALALDRTAASLSSAELTNFADRLRPIVAGKQTDALTRLLAPTS